MSLVPIERPTPSFHDLIIDRAETLALLVDNPSVECLTQFHSPADIGRRKQQLRQVVSTYEDIDMPENVSRLQPLPDVRYEHIRTPEIDFELIQLTKDGAEPGFTDCADALLIYDHDDVKVASWSLIRLCRFNRQTRLTESTLLTPRLPDSDTAEDIYDRLAIPPLPEPQRFLTSRFSGQRVVGTGAATLRVLRSGPDASDQS